MSALKRNQLSSWFHTPIDPTILSVFRILYGLFMAFGIIRYFRIGLVKNMFVDPKVNFTYDFLGWVQPLPEVYMNVLLALLLIAAFAIASGVFFKWACRFFAIGYTYIFLLDKSIYNNHIYLFILLAILLSFTDADDHISLKPNKSNRSFIPRWQVFILQAQIVIVYFYGGIAKLTEHWIFQCEPVKTLTNSLPSDYFLSSILKSEFGIYLLTYGGLLVDLSSPLLLWYKPMRKWGVLIYFLFNVMNSRIFTDIGIFPYVMLGCLILFFETREIPLLNKLIPDAKNNNTPPGNRNGKLKPVTKNVMQNGFLAAYFIFQLLFPFRGHFLPNPLDWTTIGNRFSWRMKVDTRNVEEMSFTIHSPDIGDPVPVEINTFINSMQILHLSMDPRSVAQFGKFLEGEVKKYKNIDPGIKAKIMIAYNGKPAQLFVNPDVDLSKVSYSPFRKLDWVMPLKE